jgi:hypothetical protein
MNATDKIFIDKIYKFSDLNIVVLLTLWLADGAKIT